MSKFTTDSSILALQHALQEAKENTRQAEKSGCSDQMICALMDQEDLIVAKLLSKGCHLRDC